MKPILGLEGEKLLQTIRDHVGMRRQVQARLKEFLDLYERLYLLKPKKERPLGQIETAQGVDVITNDICNAVNVMANLLNAAQVIISTFAAEPGKELKSDKAEMFYKNVLFHTRKKLGKPPLTLARMDQCKFGRGCLYPNWRQTADYIGPILERIDPRKVLWEPGGPSDEYASTVVVEKRPVPTVESKYKVSLADYSGWETDKKAEAKVDVFDVWTWEGITQEDKDGNRTAKEVVVNCIVTDKTVLKEPEVMGGYSHLPVITFGAYPTGEELLEYEFVPISFFIHTAVLLERRLRTAQFKRLDQMIRLPLVFKTTRPEYAKTVSVEEGPFVMIPLTLQEEITFPEWRGSPPDLENLGRFLDAQRQKGSFSDLALGEMLVISGIAASRFWDVNVLKMEAPAEQYAWALERCLHMFRDFAIQFGGNEKLILELGPGAKEGPGVFDILGRDLKGSKVTVEVKAAVPADIRYRDSMFGLRLLQMGDKCPFPLAYVLERWFHEDQPELLLEAKRKEIEEYGDILGFLKGEKEREQEPKPRPVLTAQPGRETAYPAEVPYPETVMQEEGYEEV